MPSYCCSFRFELRVHHNDADAQQSKELRRVSSTTCDSSLRTCPSKLEQYLSFAIFFSIFWRWHSIWPWRLAGSFFVCASPSLCTNSDVLSPVLLSFLERFPSIAIPAWSLLQPFLPISSRPSSSAPNALVAPYCITESFTLLTG